MSLMRGEVWSFVVMCIYIFVTCVQFHGFLLPVLNELNGFVSRRQQAIQAEAVHKKYLRESVATASYDLIQLVTNVTY